ncbi:hypothetical protein [Winogradskyella ursingii]|uniref:hypothetical protein n=1 Tax=Winogradskyella ursingii TaxID=2686079 RepID=UPI0015CC32BA|nr:hypothetical protein [Winogradskyella ursingii]
MKESLTFDFCEISIYDNYLIVEMSEGVTVTPEKNEFLVDLVNKYYANEPFVYITHRVNSYAVDPQVYLQTSKIENLKGFAVVSKDYKAKVNAEIEKMFLKKPFEIFSNLDEAITWSKKLTTSVKT